MNSSETWSPCSGLNTYQGCIWLPRMVEKARRYLAGVSQGRDLMGDYLFGQNDYLDSRLLRFLRLNDTALLEIVKQEGNNELVMQTCLSQSGRSEAECRAWSRRFYRWNIPFLIMIEADEGRRPPG